MKLKKHTSQENIVTSLNLEKDKESTPYVFYIYVIWRPWSVRIGKNCARGLSLKAIVLNFNYTVQIKSFVRVRLSFQTQTASCLRNLQGSFHMCHCVGKHRVYFGWYLA